MSVVVVVFLVAGACFHFDHDATATAGNVRYYSLLTLYLLLQWIWVSAVVVHMNCGPNGSAARTARTARTAQTKAYRRQVLLFLAAFLLLTAQTAATFVTFATGAINLNDADDVYLFYFGSPSLDYMGLVNAMLWGVSHSCVVNLINTCFGVDGRHGTGELTGLDMPLLATQHAVPSHVPVHTTALSHVSTDSASGMVWKDSGGRERQTIPLNHLIAKHKIGMGAFGIVYSGTYDKQDVAIKEVDREQVSMKRREVKR